jgi:amino acid permease
MGSFVINTPVVFNMIEKEDEMMSSNFIYILRRIIVVVFIWVLSVLLPDINVVLSLFAGSICGTLLFVLPVFFYR